MGNIVLLQVILHIESEISLYLLSSNVSFYRPNSFSPIVCRLIPTHLPISVFHTIVNKHGKPSSYIQHNLLYGAKKYTQHSQSFGLRTALPNLRRHLINSPEPPPHAFHPPPAEPSST